MEPDVAVIVVVPEVKPITAPLVGTVSLIVATAVADELQVTLPVTFFMLPSSKVPVAIKEVAVVAAIETVGGVTEIEVKAGATVKVVDPLMPPDAAVAVMVVVPPALPVASPLASMLAATTLEELQTTELVKSLVVPPE
jgi:hypothetical protein